MDHKEKNLDKVYLNYSYPYTLKRDIHIGAVWEDILNTHWRDRDFKWNGRTFYFKSKQDLMLFMLKWS